MLWGLSGSRGGWQLLHRLRSGEGGQAETDLCDQSSQQQDPTHRLENHWASSSCAPLTRWWLAPRRVLLAVGPSVETQVAVRLRPCQ